MDNIENELIPEENTEAEISEEALDEEDAASEYNDLACHVEKIENELAEANDNYRRLFAEYDNYRKRTAKEKSETFTNATIKCVEDILPVFDSFERAVESECTDENYKNGMLMIYGQLKSFLEKLEVKEVAGVGSEFDPNIHNAIGKTDSEEHPTNTVCQVYMKGYKLGDKLVRPAMVIVAN